MYKTTEKIKLNSIHVAPADFIIYFQEEVELTKLAAPPVRQRSASLSAAPPTAAEEEPCRRTSVGGEPSTLPPPPVPPRKSSLLDLGESFKLRNIRQLPRKLSTTVREWIDVPAIQDKLSR